MAHSFVGRDLAVDLGTASTRVYARGRGVVLDEPSLVCFDGGEVVRPLRGGVIADFDAAAALLQALVQRSAAKFRLSKPRIVVCVPTDITAVELRVVNEAAYFAGARSVFTVSAPLAAAIGAGVPIHRTTGNMLVDIGAGVTQAAVFAGGAVTGSASARSAGDDVERAIAGWLRKHHGLTLTRAEVEDVKQRLGSAYPSDEGRAQIRGRDVCSGQTRQVETSVAEVRRAIDEPVSAVLDVVRRTLDQTPGRVVAQIKDHGIVLTGGGSLLTGLSDRIAHETGISVHRAEGPRTTAVRGAGLCVEEFGLLRHVVSADERRIA
jgi:rod shape-determining protein MreB